MNVYCDDGSTTIKLAWNDNGKICKSLSQNSFRHGWKVDGLGIRQTFNYELNGKNTRMMKLATNLFLRLILSINIRMLTC